MVLQKSLQPNGRVICTPLRCLPGRAPPHAPSVHQVTYRGMLKCIYLKMCPEHAGSARVSSVHQEQKSGNSFVRECPVAKVMLEL